MQKIKSIYWILKWTGLLCFFNRVSVKTNKHIVLCYHRISEEKLNQHINYFTTHFDVVSLKALLDHVFHNHEPIILSSHKPLLALTMDDCYSKEFHQAFTVCQKQQVHCTYFVPTHYAEKQVSLWSLRLIDMLKRLELPCTITDFDGVKVTFSQEQDKRDFELKWIKTFLDNQQQTHEIEELFVKFYVMNKLEDHADPVIGNDIIASKAANTYTSFQSHTVTHPKLYLCTATQLQHEFEASKAYLSKLSINENQYVICYPYGSAVHIGDSYKEASNYYEYGVTLQSGLVTKQTHQMLVPRIGIYEHDTYQSICVKIFFAQLRSIF
jgi:peptidoglycan/xylan/chitin deacetylase (PgdA/CDA1 family)